MKKAFILFSIVAMLAIFFATPSPTYAWPWSSKYNVKIDLKFKASRGILAGDAVDCKSATLSVGAKTYTASVSNPWLSNNCSLTFNNVDVKTNGNYTVTLKYRYYVGYGSTYTKNLTVALSRPVLATLTKAYTIYP
ncbi:MAG TPA: hypothetical protein VIO36_12050 [Anaerolineaceae bacterium]